MQPQYIKIALFFLRVINQVGLKSAWHSMQKMQVVHFLHAKKLQISFGKDMPKMSKRYEYHQEIGSSLFRRRQGYSKDG